MTDDVITIENASFGRLRLIKSYNEFEWILSSDSSRPKSIKKLFSYFRV